MLNFVNMLHRFELCIKEIFDFILGIFFLVFFSPLILLAAFAVKLESPGPAFFKQARVGKDRREFSCYKIRSMYLGSSDIVHREYIKKLMLDSASVSGAADSVYKLTNDARITKVGRFIRKTSIDELPQLFNVIKGDMSLVGYRPAIFYELEFYTPDMLNRFLIKPGVTGLWQVGGRSGLTYRQMVEKDLTYIKNWSLLLDLKILVKTALYVLNISRAH